MFIQIDRMAQRPIYRQIEEKLRKLIAQGTLRPGNCIRSTRLLAAKLGVNRLTIQTAFNKLEADGLISSHVRKGTFVNFISAPGWIEAGWPQSTFSQFDVYHHGRPLTRVSAWHLLRGWYLGGQVLSLYWVSSP
jgi:DNA-binding transcriptional MocR family regulator